MLIERFVEVPNTNIQEPVLASQFADELCLSISEDYGYAEVVWYALNGTRVVEGSYGNPALVGGLFDVLLQTRSITQIRSHRQRCFSGM